MYFSLMTNSKVSVSALNTLWEKIAINKIIPILQVRKLGNFKKEVNLRGSLQTQASQKLEL